MRYTRFLPVCILYLGLEFASSKAAWQQQQRKPVNYESSFTANFVVAWHKAGSRPTVKEFGISS